MASTERQIRRAMLALAGHPAIGPRLAAAEAAVALSSGGDLLWANAAATRAFGPALAGADGLLAALRRHRPASSAKPAVARLRTPTVHAALFVCRLEPIAVDGEAAFLAVVLDPPAPPLDTAARLDGLVRALARDGYAAVLDTDDTVLAEAGHPGATEGAALVAVAGTPWRIVVDALPDSGMDAPPSPPAPAPARPDVAAPAGIVGAAPAVAAARPAGARPGPVRSAARRFTWQTDADDRFTFVSSELAAAIGAPGRIVGRRWHEIADALGLDPAGRVAANLARRLTWSGITVDWPTAEGHRVPVDLAGLSLNGPDGAFGGFRGFGTVRPVEPGLAVAPTPSADAAPAHEPAPIPTGRTGAAEAAASSTASPAAEPPPPPAPAEGAGGGLSRPEWEAFRLVAAALGARFDGDPATAGASDGGDGDTAADDSVVAAATTAPPADADSHERTASGRPAPPNGRRLAVPAAANDAGLLDRIPVALLVCRGDRLIHANPAALALLGYRDGAALAAAGGLAALFVEPAPADSRPVRVRRADGGTDAVDARITSIPWNGGSALLVALTPAAATSAAAASAGPADSLLDGVVDAVLVLGPGGAVAAVNRAGERLFGMPRAGLIGRGFPALVAPEARLAVAAAVQAAAAGDGDRVETVPLLAADGAAREAVLSIGRAGDGAAARLCVVLRPVGPAAAGEDPAAATARAAAERSTLVAHLSHEVRTPINAIVGFAEMMLEERLGPLGEPRYRDYLRDVRASGLHVLSLVDDLLDLARTEAGHADLERAPVALNDVVREAVSMMQATAAQGRVVLRLALSEPLPPVTADRRSLRQILLNLLSNAVKFNVAGGQVIVSTSVDAAGAVTLRVRDTGIGMTGAEAAMALEPFRRVHGARFGGTGLGLPITKALAEANGAGFAVSSEPRRGTLVEITFPVAAAAAPQRRDASS